MPIAAEMTNDLQQVKMLVIGNSKVGKTHYAMTAARQGFKVLYIDGDSSRPTIASFDQESLKRTFYLPFNDAIGNGMYVPRFALLLRKFLSGKLEWNDTKRRSAIPAEDAGDDVWEILAPNLDTDWVVVIDSWSSVAYSIMSVIALNAGVDLGDMEKAGRSVYASANNMATDILSKIRALNCHVIVIAHPDEFVKYKIKRGNQQDAGKASNQEVEWTRMIPKSISRNHALSLASYFTDVAWLEATPMGKRILNFELSPDKDGGGRFEGKVSADEAPFGELVRRAGGKIPESVSFDNDPGLIHHPDWTPPGGKGAQKTVLSNTGSAANPTQVKGPSGPFKLQLGKK